MDKNPSNPKIFIPK